MTSLALNVYHWGEAQQSRLLAECLGPAARALRGAGLVRRCWFLRFDVRGPHVLAVFAGPDGGREEVAARLAARVEAYLAAHPSRTVLSPDELEVRHAACRGTLCALDAEPGIAPNDSYGIVDHPRDGYPFRLGAGARDEDALWEELAEAALWAVDRLRAGGETAAAIRWIADVDRALQSAGADAAGYWRHYAATLLPPLARRLEAGDEEAVVAGLPRVVGERNGALFAAAWEAAAQGPAWPRLPRLVELAAADDGRPLLRRWMLLREVNHGILSQLNQFVQVRIPLALYAWLRSAPATVPA